MVFFWLEQRTYISNYFFMSNYFFCWRLLCLFERAEKANLSSSQQHCYNLFKSCDFIFVLYFQCIPFHAMSAKVHIMHKNCSEGNIATRIQPPQNVRLFRVSKRNVTRVNINNYVEVVYFKVENIEFLTIWFQLRNVVFCHENINDWNRDWKFDVCTRFFHC